MSRHDRYQKLQFRILTYSGSDLSLVSRLLLPSDQLLPTAYWCHLYTHKNLLPNSDVVVESLRGSPSLGSQGLPHCCWTSKKHQGRESQQDSPNQFYCHLNTPGWCWAWSGLSYLTSPAIWEGGGGEREESWKIRNREHRCLHGEHYCSLCDPWPITKAMHFRTTLTLSINSGSSAVLLSSRSNIYEGFRRCKINLILSV